MFQHVSNHLKARLTRVSPDRLWLHYVLALIIILGLLVIMSIVNQQIFARSAVAATAEEMTHLRQMQWLILGAAMLVLLAEATFIFYPAHLAVQAHIRMLQDQTACLLDSKRELEQANVQLLHLTNHDVLTGLPNRGRLIAFMAESFAHGTAADQTFLFIGLDGFKSINDSAGHESGDALLIAVGKALRGCVDDDQIVARIGGDEFAMMTNEPPAPMLRRVMAALADPFEVCGRRLKIRASIGFLVMEKDRADPLDVLADAAMALQVAKNEGGNRARQFTPALRATAGQLQRLQMEVPDAIRNGELEPWFQPQIRLIDGALHGVEVLARWRHPTRGLLTPDRFLSAVERAGMTIEMDHAIWQAAMAQAMKWQTEGIWHPVLSLNAAPETIADPFLIERFLLGLRNSGLRPDQVIVEVLENTLIDGAGDMAAINIDSLSECGIALELDDFGTGYASLCRLTQLPLSGIKLDKSLIAPLPDQGADSVVRAILALTAELGLHVIAEGIEETGQAQHLLDRGCAVGQGYGFARPMPPKDFELWLCLHADSPITIADHRLALVNEA
ncbi:MULTISPECIES: putative bifunctional diguanylate cyclase/phosphodiesterase [unclassified Yoonia]|uniref:putative bifunctional diguanylate cyclase/phosphodiesterase n=1 Tax=unclassified Yoonia TaxID=2629118 RepID=UPI002B003AC5|nr:MULTISPECIES: EAL domain-containing protein [unclassified Yoonia]